ncbi:four helix bundle protein [Persicobacter diffluens]|uniref:Four helix bundle protein n=1 Tax=Persicobacter diffluens TaxID=981 RepID=A0AAN4VYX9_9BACT|nr:four helix bundle protein [Persicobacter diffluens]
MNQQMMEDRLVDFSVVIFQLVRTLKHDFAAEVLAKQMIRSATSPALNYGEARAAESRKDYIHKLSIALKELRETMVSLKIIEKAALSSNTDVLASAKQECNELISILVVTIKKLKMNK